jgi:hypothetical protein
MSDMMTFIEAYVSTFLKNGRFVTIYRSYSKKKKMGARVGAVG